jgi:hypothetical protein
MENDNRIKNIIKDTDLLKESMEIINELLIEQEEKLNYIEDEIKYSSSEIKEGNIYLSDKEYSSLSYIYYLGGIIIGIFYLTIR